MKNRKIVITEQDLKRLKTLIEEAIRTRAEKADHLKPLQAELERAELVASTDIPNDVVTMNSVVGLRDLDSDEEMTYTLVFPKDADATEDRISILAPIGTAMLGYAVGNTFSWKVPDGTRRLRVEKIVYQPEAKGNFDQ